MLVVVPTGRGKSFTPEQNERIRAAVRSLLPSYDGNRTALARKLGISQPVMSLFLNGNTGAGMQFALAVAGELGTSIDTLIGAVPRDLHVEDVVDHRPINRNRRGWTESEPVALARWPRDVTPERLVLGREMRNLAGPEIVTPEYVRDVCQLVGSWAPDEELERAKRAAEMDAKIEADRRAFEERERKAVAESKTPPGAPGPRKPKRGGRG